MSKSNLYVIDEDGDIYKSGFDSYDEAMAYAKELQKKIGIAVGVAAEMFE